MSAIAIECPICGLDGVERRDDLRFVESWWKCRRCGEFFANLELVQDLPHFCKDDAGLRPALMAACRQASERGSLLKLNSQNFKEIAEPHRDVRVSVKARKLLEALASRAKRPGGVAPVNLDIDYPLLDAESSEEMRAFLVHLREQELVNWDGTMGADQELEITIQGWTALESIGRDQIVRGRVFVAMSFDESLNEAYTQGLEPAIREDAGCDPQMLKGAVHTENINNKILAEIARAEFVVADLTLRSHGVYFEAGYAMALGRPVVFTCRSDDWDDRHFDTEHYPTIKWTAPADLRSKLADWLIRLKGIRRSSD